MKTAMGALHGALLAGMLALAGCGGPAAGPAAVSTPTASTRDPAVATHTAPAPPPTPCTVAADRGLNLRSGPGTAYNVIAVLPDGLAVYPQAANNDGSWLEVTGESGQPRGWVSRDYLRCPPALASLPLVTPPPTPMPPPTATPGPTSTPEPPPSPTPFTVSYTEPPNQDGDPGNLSGRILIPGEAVASPLPIFRDRLVFQLEVSDRAGEPNGHGVQKVEITISQLDEFGSIVADVYRRTEGNPPYCAFGNQEPFCEKIWVFQATDYFWPLPGQEFSGHSDIAVDPNAVYRAGMLAITDTGDSGFWFFDFKIERP